MAETEGSKIARKAFTGKALRKQPFPTHTSTHTKNDRFFDCLGRPDSQFHPAERRFESCSNSPRIKDGYLAVGEVLDIARRSAAPLDRAQAAIIASN